MPLVYHAITVQVVIDATTIIHTKSSIWCNWAFCYIIIQLIFNEKKLRITCIMLILAKLNKLIDLETLNDADPKVPRPDPT